MPIEIRELVIKATVNQDQTQAASNNNAGAADNDAKEAEVREAVEEVLRILENKKER